MKYKIAVLLIITQCFILSAANDLVLIKIDAGIGPATSAHIKRGIERAEAINAQAIIIKLNTPGGLLESTRDIVSYILESKVPVVVYVAPSGARAGSAGVFITLAANIAVMAPGTNIGAAHPVGIGGEASKDTLNPMNDKITNDACAFARTIAQKRNRNQTWAELAVRESISSTENEALNDSIIDFIAPNINTILNQINGKNVLTASGNRTIYTSNSKIEYLETSWREDLLGFLSDPNIAYIFILLTIYGVMFELYNPGSIFPGVVGAISAVIAAYSLQMLPVNSAGIALIVVAIILFILEIKVISYGMLSIGGITSFVLGSTMLFDSPDELINISLSLIIVSTIFTILFFGFIISLGIKAQYKKNSIGNDSLIGETALTITDLLANTKGKVKINGEIWNAISQTNIPAGTKVIVEKIDLLTIFVKPIQ